MQIKKCPVCFCENNVDMVVCCECGMDISGVITSNKKEENENSKKVCATCGEVNESKETNCKKCLGQNFTNSEPQCENNKKYLYLIYENDKIKINDGDIIGRESIGKETFEKIETISRKHAKFSVDNDEWYIEDLASTNGVYINEVKIEPNKKVKLNLGDKIGLSKKFQGMVEI